MTAPTGGRSAYDPFAPAAPGFPDRRLRRAGVDDETVARLRDEYAGMDPAARQEVNRFVTRNPNSRIAARFQGRYSRTELEAMTVDELHPLLRERQLSIQGRKADLIDRLTASYDAPKGALTAEPVPVVPDTQGEPPEADSGSQAAATGTPSAAPTPTADADRAPDTATEGDDTNG
jgi:hypothetical protein